MMRSLFSGVAGLKTHQTKMDVIGNNISNVNTTAYKSQSITFNELMYQTTKRASGANATTGTGGTNANQIGLGVKVGAINTAITSQGATQTTNMPFDLNITGSNFFVVNNGSETFFTRAGSFYVDGAGNLAMTSTGYNVMGWQVDPETGEPAKETVSPLKIMIPENMTYEAAPTTLATVTGAADKYDSDINSSRGKAMNLEFYDNLGFKYTAKFGIHVSDGDAGEFYAELKDIVDANGESIGPEKMALVGFGADSQAVTTSSPNLIKSEVTATQMINITPPGAAANTPPTQVGSGVTYAITTGAFADPDGTGPLGALTQVQVEALYSTGTPAAPALNLATAKSATIDTKGNMTVTYNDDSVRSFSPLPNAAVAVSRVTLSDGATPTPATLTLGVGSGLRYSVDDAGVITPPTTTSTPALAVPTAAEIEAFYGISLDDVNEFEIAEDGTLTITNKDVSNAAILRYSPATGIFRDANGAMNGQVTLDFTNTAAGMDNFTDVMIDFSTTNMTNKDMKSTLGIKTGGTGDNAGLGTGRKEGTMLGVVVDDSGRLYANYSNGQSRLLGQIATAAFANASGLEKKGDNLYAETLNSGPFDGIGEDIKTSGGYMTSGVLEMSNVDLSAEFTDMITTQRGFQANSRIITVSDTLLEELTNLKR